MLDMTWSSDTTKDPLILADAIELAVAFAKDDYNGRFTRADFQNIVTSEILSDDERSYLTGDQADERIEQFEQARDLIGKRASWLGVAYPFKVIANEVEFSPPTAIEKCLPYLFLLVCSNGNCVPSLKSALSDQFEDLCKEAFRSLFPEWARVLLFSQKSKDRKEHFGWKASDAVPKLAEMLNAKLVSADQLSSTQREFGIDLIAICPFDDQSAYPFFAFAQCTIEQEWWNRRHEAIAETALTGFVNLNVGHSNFLMIPHFPRNSLKKWSEDPGRTGNCILCDRYRLCRLLDKSKFFEHDNPPESLAVVFQTLNENLIQSF